MNSDQKSSKINTTEDISLKELAKFFFSKRKPIITVAIISFVCSVVIALSLPHQFTVSVKVAPEESESGKMSSAMSGLASFAGLASMGSSSGVTQLLYPEIIKSSPFLSEFATIEVPFKDENITLMRYLSDYQKRAWWSYLSPLNLIGTANKPEESIDIHNQDPFRPSRSMLKFEKDLFESLVITHKEDENIFEISVTMQDPYIAAVVADSIVVKLDKYMTNYKTSKTRSSIASTLTQLQKAEKAYHEAEDRYAEGTDINRRLVTEKAKSRIQRLENEKNLAYSIYEQIALELETQKVELDEKTPILTIIQPSRVPIQKSAPKTSMVVVGLTFLGVVVTMMYQFVKHTF